MYLQIECVALRTIKYSDKANILTAWSPQLGRISLLLNAGQGKESRRRRALTTPMSLIEACVDVRPGKEILAVREMRALEVMPTLTVNPIKISVAMFIAEVLGTVLHESGTGDSTTWQLIRNSAWLLDRATTNRNIANFVLWFMYQLCVVQGIEPDAGGYKKGYLLDLREGIYRTTAPLHQDFLNAEESGFAYRLSRITPRHLTHLSIPSHARARTLNIIIDYFGMHHTSLSNLRSLSVLQTVLH